jgi:hypothetical protein
LRSGFRKISRVGGRLGGTRWYLSEDCLLAAKQIMYTVEYRRFYLSDLEYVVVWPSRRWLWRLIVPAAVLAATGGSLWAWVDSTAGEVFVGIALAWLALELALGPTAKSSIRTTGATVDLPLVSRTRRARKILAKIDAAVRSTRAVMEQSSASSSASSFGESNTQEKSESAATVSVAPATQTNGS